MKIVGDMEVWDDSRVFNIVQCSHKCACAQMHLCVEHARACVCVSFGQGRSVWVMLCTAVVQMTEATCSLPFLHFLLTSIIYTFSQTYKQPPIRPTLTRSTPALNTHTCTCTQFATSYWLCTDAVCVCVKHLIHFIWSATFNSDFNLCFIVLFDRD